MGPRYAKKMWSRWSSVKTLRVLTCEIAQPHFFSRRPMPRIRVAPSTAARAASNHHQGYRSSGSASSCYARLAGSLAPPSSLRCGGLTLRYAFGSATPTLLFYWETLFRVSLAEEKYAMLSQTIPEVPYALLA